jgi:sulfatase maturation enzyme AslB (radical SAM superfamily)
MTLTLPLLDTPAPLVPLTHLDDLWFQVAGTLCNLECRHCFISCHPHNHTFGFLNLETVRRALEDSVHLGVKEYYFTGGEPFLNPEMTAILEMTLRYGPATVLTNGTILRNEWLGRLVRAEASTSYSLEFRVSLDGFTAADNDPIRGEGTFVKIVAGIRRLAAHGFLPIVTVTRTRDDQDDAEMVKGFCRLLRDQGYNKPRIKVLPTLRLGAEITRQRGYQPEERVTTEMMQDYDASRLLCNHSRMVTNRGVFVCPILIESPAARLGDTLEQSLFPYSLRHNACYTCYQHGALCANPSGGQHDV